MFFSKKNAVLLIMLTVLSILTVPTTSKAATWSYGIPKTLRGNWKAHHDKIFHTHYVFGKNYIHGYSNDPDFLNNTKFKKLRHGMYKINGYEPYYSKQRHNTYVKRHGKHITFYYKLKGHLHRNGASYYK